MNHKDKQIGKLLKIVGKAINTYNMIEANDNILIALSGGKDSLVLMDALHRRLKHIPIHYNLFCCHVIVKNFHNSKSIDRLKQYCCNYDIPLYIKEITLDLSRKNSSPCFVCSWFRRKILFETAAELGCKKIAFGHNQDDIIITFFMNMLYHGKLSTMPPKLKMFNGTLEIIRPLAFLTEAEVKGYCSACMLSPVENECPYKDLTKRNHTKELLKIINKSVKGAQSSIFRSLSHREDEYLL
ncbi:MAG: tRNA 2-thiocytidine(32) synthetase TtcA [Spirochaetes bacterium]|nr:tRNA 2-thiocytidine(32) synthetase TtcA [Spirochaetota bacterium]